MPSKQNEYFVRRKSLGKVIGPIGRSKLTKYLAEGKLAPNDEVSPDQQTWYRAGELSGFRGATPSERKTHPKQVTPALGTPPLPRKQTPPPLPPAKVHEGEQRQPHLDVMANEPSEQTRVAVTIRTPPIRSPRSKQEQSISLPQLLGIAGSVLVAVGVFCPLVQIPIAGTRNYFMNGEGDGVFVLGIAVVGLLASLFRWHHVVGLFGFGVACFLSYTFYRFRTGQAEARRSLEDDLADNPFGGFAALAIESVELQWGFGLMLVGALGMLAASFATFSRQR